MCGRIVDSILGRELYSEGGTHLSIVMNGDADGFPHVCSQSGTVLDGGNDGRLFCWKGYREVDLK